VKFDIQTPDDKREFNRSHCLIVSGRASKEVAYTSLRLRPIYSEPKFRDGSDYGFRTFDDYDNEP